MRLFIAILIGMAVLGGMAGAEISGNGFSIIGALTGGIGTATILLGLGAYFTAQEEKKKADIPDEVRAVFDRMITGQNNPTQEQILKAKKEHRKTVKAASEKATDTADQFRNTLNALINLKPEYETNDPYRANAIDATFAAAKQSAKIDKNDLRNDVRDPYDIALTTLWNISNQEVSSGRHHVYRGVLSGGGQGYLYVFKKTVDILHERGIIDEKEAKKNRDMIQRNVKGAG